MTFSREDIYARSESGGEVFEELRRILSADLSFQEMMNSINNKKTETFDEVVARYRIETGLEVVSDKETENVKTAAKKSGSFISKRQKVASRVMELLKEHPEVVKEIDSFCVHSGGTKNIHVIIHHIKERLGNEEISHSDQDLVKFIEDRLNEHKQDFDNKDFEVGKVGITPENDKNNSMGLTNLPK